MANYNKSFNFRNGVQVDNDNFVVNANGLVGIGTTVPKDYLLNVYGDTRITGLVTTNSIQTTNLTSSGVSTVGFLTAANIQVSGVVTATTFYGSASGLTGISAIAVDGWYISGGNISTTSKVGIGTTLPTGNFQVGVGVTINNNGNATYSGILTASSFVGSGANITLVNASNISSGTLNNARLPSNINLSGIITGYSFSGFGTGITNINASNISSGTLNNARLPSNINLSGIITGYSFSGFGTDITNINASNISSGTLSNSRLPSNINLSGIITASNFDGIASTAQSITGSPNIIVTNITASNSNISGISTVSTTTHVGSGGTAFAALNSGRIGIGTAIPTSEIQVRKSTETFVEVISDTSQARISIGQSVGVGKSTAFLRFGYIPKTFDIINNDTGNINMYLHAGAVGVSTGKFAWVYGQNNSELMSLDYDGTLTATNNVFLGSSGISTVTVQNNLYVNNDLIVNGSISGSISYPSIISGTNLNNTLGITTLRSLNVTSNIGINSENPIAALDAKNSLAVFGSVGIATTVTQGTSLYCNGFASFNSIGIGTTGIYQPLGQSAGILQVHNDEIRIFNGGILLDSQLNSSIGFGTNLRRSILDFGIVGSATSYGYFIAPTVTTSDRSTFANISGLTTVMGAIIYNSTTFKHQGYGSTDGGLTFKWQDLY